MKMVKFFRGEGEKPWNSLGVTLCSGCILYEGTDISWNSKGKHFSNEILEGEGCNSPISILGLWIKTNSLMIQIRY